MKKIVLIGDSIRQGYDKYVKKAFNGIAEVFYPSDNCRFTSYILRNLTEWAEEMGCGEDVDLVHWNAGLWDDLVMIDGKQLVRIEHYAENVQRICDVIKILFPKAKIVFATSTPVQEELFLGKLKRYNCDTKAYNEKAIQIVKANGGYIDDIYSVVENCPKEYYSDLTHLYTKNGTKIITEQVVKVIENILGIKANNLDFDALFSGEKNATGI
ncbi:MAG: hypothetical protein E7347_05125 [Clostridiales bacterium]|nr:hypothetical protein [Clostridiales bacterium]